MKSLDLITASKVEKPKKEEPSDAQKALGALAVVAAAIAWLIATDGMVIQMVVEEE